MSSSQSVPWKLAVHIPYSIGSDTSFGRHWYGDQREWNCPGNIRCTIELSQSEVCLVTVSVISNPSQGQRWGWNKGDFEETKGIFVLMSCNLCFSKASFLWSDFDISDIFISETQQKINFQHTHCHVDLPDSCHLPWIWKTRFRQW